MSKIRARETGGTWEKETNCVRWRLNPRILPRFCFKKLRPHEIKFERWPLEEKHESFSFSGKRAWRAIKRNLTSALSWRYERISQKISRTRSRKLIVSAGSLIPLCHEIEEFHRRFTFPLLSSRESSISYTRHGELQLRIQSGSNRNN